MFCRQNINTEEFENRTLTGRVWKNRRVNTRKCCNANGKRGSLILKAWIHISLSWNSSLLVEEIAKGFVLSNFVSYSNCESILGTLDQILLPSNFLLSSDCAGVVWKVDFVTGCRYDHAICISQKWILQLWMQSTQNKQKEQKYLAYSADCVPLLQMSWNFAKLILYLEDAWKSDNEALDIMCFELCAVQKWIGQGTVPIKVGWTTGIRSHFYWTLGWSSPPQSTPPGATTAFF